MKKKIYMLILLIFVIIGINICFKNMITNKHQLSKKQESFIPKMNFQNKDSSNNNKKSHSIVLLAIEKLALEEDNIEQSDEIINDNALGLDEDEIIEKDIETGFEDSTDEIDNDENIKDDPDYTIIEDDNNDISKEENNNDTSSNENNNNFSSEITNTNSEITNPKTGNIYTTIISIILVSSIILILISKKISFFNQ